MQKGWNEFSQVIYAKCKKAVHSALKKSNYGKKYHNCNEDSGSGSNSDYCNVGLDSTQDLHVLSKLRTSESLDDIVPCPMKAIPSKISHEPLDSSEDLGIQPLWLLWNHQLKICPQIFHKSPWGVTPAKGASNRVWAENGCVALEGMTTM